jgi:hypothetical protein
MPQIDIRLNSTADDDGFRKINAAGANSIRRSRASASHGPASTG